MPFPFQHVCDLLDDLHKLHVRDLPLLPTILSKESIDKANRWLRNHKSELNAFNTNQSAALWMLRPDKLDDREYGITATSLRLIIARIYQLSRDDQAKLQKWQAHPRSGDMGACVGQIRGDMANISSPTECGRVTVEEIHNALLRIASKNPESSPAVQSLSQDQVVVDPIKLLREIYIRLNGREAKWLTRFILKDYGAIMLPDVWSWEPGYSGMPNGTAITISVFTGSPPIEILDGLKRVKPNLTAQSRAAEQQSRIQREGWPRRRLRSREPSPISRPSARLKRTSLMPAPMGVSAQPFSQGFSQASSDSSAPLVWAKGVLDPNPLEFRSIVASTTTQASYAKSAPVSMGQLIPQLGRQPSVTDSPSSVPIAPRFSFGNVNPSNLREKHSVQAPKISVVELSSPPTVFNSSNPFIKANQLPRDVASVKSPMKTRIYIDLTSSPPRSCSSPAISIVSSSNRNPQSSYSTAIVIASSPPYGPPSVDPNGSNTGKAQNLPRTVLSTLSSNTVLCNQISSRPRGPPLNPTYQASNPLMTAGTGVCRMTKTECPLIRCIFLLSPSLATSPALVNELLPWHGLQYISDLKALANPRLPTLCPKTGLRYRKIVLVETRNREETVDFLSQIEDLNLSHRVKRGRRDIQGSMWTKQFVEVYDWRLLQSIAKMDRGRVFDYDPWQRSIIEPV